MSEAYVCDGCGKVESGASNEPQFAGWWTVRQFDRRKTDWYMSIDVSDHDDPEKFQVCSWECVAQLAISKADLFAGKERE